MNGDKGGSNKLLVSWRRYINYYSSRVYTGHGNFLRYLEIFTTTDRDTSLQSHFNERNIVFHYLFNCSTFSEYRVNSGLDEEPNL